MPRSFAILQTLSFDVFLKSPMAAGDFPTNNKFKSRILPPYNLYIHSLIGLLIPFPSALASLFAFIPILIHSLIFY